MRSVAALFSVLALLVAGCGGGSSKSSTTRGYSGNGGAVAAKAAVVKYFAALTSGDYAGACALIGKAAIAKIEASGKKCPDVVKAGLKVTGTTPFQDATIGAAKVNGDTGTITVALKSGQKLPENLVYEDGQWKIQRPGT